MSASGSNQGLRAGVCLSTTRPAAPYDGQMIYETDTDRALVWNGSSWTPLAQTIASAMVSTSQTTNSTSYTDLATVGPTVTVTTGTSALVTIQTLGAGTVANRQYMSFAVSGATTIAAGTYFIDAVAYPAGGQWSGMSVKSFVVTGLTAGSNTFTCKYKAADINQIPFADRVITVVTL